MASPKLAMWAYRMEIKMNNNFSGVFLDLAKYSAVTMIVISTVVISAAIASSKNITEAESVDLTPISAELSIKSPNTRFCPTTAKMTGWILTNQPGKISYMLAKKDGEVTGPFTLDAVKSVQGGMATFSRTLDIQQSTSDDYRILVSDEDGNVLSNWVPLKASCNIQLGSL